VALLCACADADRCHRTVIARALAERDFDGRLILREVKGDRAIDPEWRIVAGWHENCSRTPGCLPDLTGARSDGRCPSAPRRCPRGRVGDTR
jgi:hypothetical protein